MTRLLMSKLILKEKEDTIKIFVVTYKKSSQSRFVETFFNESVTMTSTFKIYWNIYFTTVKASMSLLYWQRQASSFTSFKQSLKRICCQNQHRDKSYEYKLTRIKSIKSRYRKKSWAVYKSCCLTSSHDCSNQKKVV